MNSDELKGRWTEMKGKARSKWGELTDDELAQVEGDREQLIGLIQQKYGKAKADAEREVDTWMDSSA